MSFESKRVWAPLKRCLDNRKLHYQRFEDKMTPGIPDVNVYLPRQYEWWIELKYVADFPQSALQEVTIGLRPEQLIWLQDAAQAGRHVAVVARVGTRWMLWVRSEAFLLLRRPTPWNVLWRWGLEFASPEDLLNWLGHL